MDTKQRFKSGEDPALKPLTISDDAALHESARCLSCYNPPCTEGCPAGIPVGDFIRRIKGKDREGAADLILQANPFGTVCGFVCPEDILCEKNCIRQKLDAPVRIRELQKFVTLLYADTIKYMPAQGKKSGPSAVLGGGPAGLACAFRLALRGVKVDIYEKRPYPGGVAYYSLPSFRLPHKALEKDIQRLLELNINWIEQDIITIGSSDMNKYRSVFIALGLDRTPDMNIPGENLARVVSSEEFLSDVKHKPETIQGERYSSIMVVGGGNTAMDCALSARKMFPQSRVILSYRRRFEEMPAWEREKSSCFEAGIDFLLQTIPIKIQGEQAVQSVILRRTKPGEADSSGRCRPVEIPGSNFTMPCDLFIKALGQRGPEYITRLFPELKMDRNARIITGEEGRTNLDHIWAGGDCCNGGKTVVEAVAEGKKAADSMYSELQEDINEYNTAD